MLLLGLADFIERGEWDKQISKVQKVYAAKLDALASSLHAHCDKWLTFERPKGGLYIWCTLRDDVEFDAGTFDHSVDCGPRLAGQYDHVPHLNRWIVNAYYYNSQV